ncbi:MAG: hypothetical protein GY774_35765 [Planctomycetes bacterium]|nr:hypothetical protein [Planctomycetota bacterium]
MFDLLKQALQRIAQIIGFGPDQPGQPGESIQQTLARDRRIPSIEGTNPPGPVQDISSQVSALNLQNLGTSAVGQPTGINDEMLQPQFGGLPQNFNAQVDTSNPFGFAEPINNEPIKTGEFNEKTQQFDQVFTITSDMQMKIEKLPDGFVSMFVSEDEGNTWRDMTADEENWIPLYLQKHRPDIASGM